MCLYLCLSVCLSVCCLSICMYVCLSVCRSVCPFASHKRHVQTSQHVLYMLPVAVGRSSSDDNAIGYVLLGLWTTSRLSIMEHTDIAYLRFSYLFARGRQPVYTFTVNRLRTALAVDASSTVDGDEVCYPRLPCLCNIEQELPQEMR